MKISTSQRGDLALIPYQPKTPIKERLEWLTDVITAHDGTESRTQRRTNPRQFFTYEIPLTYSKKIDSLNTLRGGLRDYWAVPIWTESQFVGDITAGQFLVTCNTTDYYFENSSLVFFYNSVGDFTVGEIGASGVGSGQIILSNSVDEVDNAYMMPLKKAWLVNDGINSTNGLESTIKYTFLIQDYTGFFTPTPDTFDSFSIYNDASIFENRIEKTISQSYMLTDFKLADVYHHNHLDNSQNTYQYKQVLEGVTELNDYKKFLYDCKGKYSNFFMPSFESDYELKSTGTITTSIQVERNSADDYLYYWGYISINTTGCGNTPVKLTSLQVIDDTTLQLNFDSVVSIESEDVTNISLLNFNRLNADSIELNWVGNNVVRSAINVLESDLNNEPLPILVP